MGDDLKKIKVAKIQYSVTDEEAAVGKKKAKKTKKFLFFLLLMLFFNMISGIFCQVWSTAFGVLAIEILIIFVLAKKYQIEEVTTLLTALLKSIIKK